MGKRLFFEIGSRLEELDKRAALAQYGTEGRLNKAERRLDNLHEISGLAERKATLAQEMVYNRAKETEQTTDGLKDRIRELETKTRSGLDAELRELRGRIVAVNDALNALADRVSVATAPADELLRDVKGITSDLASQVSRLEKRVSTVEAATAIDAKGVLTEGDGTAQDDADTIGDAASRAALKKVSRKARRK